ncbi:DUF1844 domain-containing protein [Desulfonatronospira sp.]|uniref:DUF1844 domain-containing protein n=1 Tax=Desulfonatronospira sp. TaxID=1962951 RepID=UPI0025C0D802|nr:DUF1844 domain-containing protein [Desulfonatronospira sp.]
MEEYKENIKVTDRRINYEDDDDTVEGIAGESQAKKMERKKAADDYKHVAADRENSFPRMDFSTFVFSLSTSALAHLGEMPNPENEEKEMNLPLARQTIDLLAMLEEKTRGNLTPVEEQQLKDFLFEVRMKYVQKAR